MYIPRAFSQPDLEKLYAAVERFSFAVLISSGGGLLASHLPLLVDRSTGGLGTLLGHMARANNHWRQAAGHDVLAVFSGPHAYISPAWYGAAGTVPTWNYLAVHIYGQLELIEDTKERNGLLKRTVEYYEASRPTPWSIDESTQFFAELAEGIVAFRIPIARIEGKWKLNQNRPLEQRLRVIEALRQSRDHHAQAVADAMADTLPT